ncbi:MAG: hypothetical protein WBB82_13450 [Limnothrix sp.]
MTILGLPENKKVFHELVTAYEEPCRYYHTLAHLENCLVRFDEVKDLLQSPEEVELALWFHDVVYDPHSTTNESDSAVWLKHFLESGDRPLIQINRVYSHILATQYHYKVTDSDRQFMLDIDLAILGSTAAEFRKFELNIRREYAWVSQETYCRKRVEVLQSFFGYAERVNSWRSPIYQTDYFREHYEAQAEQNVAQAITSLQEGRLEAK